ncbi:queuine tRNA-ribosyltransferase family protein [Blattabacterium sp. (Cryptocercus kyebangensis)]|uniref:queuine tRNA-ribosyltransferase family protein n=1 Tax=Blattabacterium sp. (Cryptocercus kyebangensis) TaxID=298656 RepID=UPI001F1EDB45|nr:queuine tRNA-ribosyltransferase family protein [Blattabacterium sp. (Cryptocercus kyebangensis)]
MGIPIHLYFRPKIEFSHYEGKIHSFMNWKESILTDSGFFQIYSMKKLNKIIE